MVSTKLFGLITPFSSLIKTFSLSQVLNKYDDNTWLGTQYRSTQSVPGEWPVSYHGTSLDCAVDIIEGFYKVYIIISAAVTIFLSLAICIMAVISI